MAHRPAWVDTDLYPFQTNTITVAGHRLHYIDEGEGPVMLMIHGNPAWTYVWRDAIKPLGAWRGGSERGATVRGFRGQRGLP